MKLKETTWRRSMVLWLIPFLAFAGCGQNASQDAGARARAQEIERLRQENQELPQVRADNEEVQRLKKDNQDLAKLRSQYQEANRLKKENEQLRQQVTKLAPNAKFTNVVVAADEAATPDAEKPKPMPGDELALNEGDDVMVEPRFLKQLLPDIDWDKLARKEPLGVRAIFEKDGLQLTNALQLHEYGITNFVIRRAAPVPAGQAQPKPVQ